MPVVEGRFHTYAESTSDEDLKASRDHRIFGGFSLGSVTTWLEFCYDYDYIKYFIPMSGSSWYYGGYGDFQIERNVDFIEQLVKDNELDERGYFIYHAVGTNDAVKSQSIDMADEMLSREIFTPDHYVFYQKDGGYHDFNAVEEYLYNALPVIFDKLIQTEESDNAVSMEKEITKTEITEYYTKNTLISEVQSDPAFDNYQDNYDINGNYIGSEPDGYYLTQSVTVTSSNLDTVEMISRDISSLLDKGVELFSDSPEYYYTALDELKLDLIDKASVNAKDRIDIIAKNLGASLGKLKNSSLGVFQITAQNTGTSSYSYDGAFDTSSRFKTATITVRLEYDLK